MSKNKYDFTDLLKKQSHDCLTEEDFFPPYDNRYFQSYVTDINGGDNFADFCKEFFKLLDEEEYYN